MTAEILQLDRNTLQTTFETWTAAEATLDAQLNESLEALAAYQSHLDGWQKQLAEERTELIRVREQFERDEAAAAASRAQSSAEAGVELTAAREKIAELTASLLSRTEELRTLDNRRAEVVTELELARAREKELSGTLEEQKRLFEQERAQWNDDRRYFRETLASRDESEESIHQSSAAPATPSAGAPTEPSRAVTNKDRDRANSGAVLGSIVEQFGKLRQQRAIDRMGAKKAR